MNKEFGDREYLENVFLKNGDIVPEEPKVEGKSCWNCKLHWMQEDRRYGLVPRCQLALNKNSSLNPEHYYKDVGSGCSSFIEK
jgi:hypothetical protein